MSFVKVNDININYEMSGRGDTILFLHGLGSSLLDWEFQTSYFAKYYRVVSIDLRGHGDSDKPVGPYSMKLFANDVIALLDKLAIESVHLIGLSLGAMVAFQIAVDCPHKLKSVTIVNAVSEFIPRTFKQKFNIFLRKTILTLFGIKFVGKVLSRKLFPKPEQEGFRNGFLKRWQRNKKHTYLSSAQAIIGWSVTEKIANINLPTLVIASDGDYTPIEVKQKFVRKMPNAEFQVVENSGHATPADQPEKFNNIVERFIKKY